MGNPKVSVIMPVYNTGKYLAESLSSIQNQTLSDIEIIVINDGSRDDSLSIIEAAAQKDSRIKYFSTPNRGQSVARNLGLDNASGDFIYFMDSDDKLDLDTFRICHERCLSQNLKMVIFDGDVFAEYDGADMSRFSYTREGQIEDRLYTGEEILGTLLDKDVFSASPCLFLVNRNSINKIKLRFYPGIIHEDELFTPLLYLACDRVGYIPRSFFHRRVRENSIMTNDFTIRNARGYLTVIEEINRLKAGNNYRAKEIMNRLIGNDVDSVAYRSHVLSAGERIFVFRKILFGGFLTKTSLKSLLVLLFPFTITLKSKLSGFSMRRADK